MLIQLRACFAIQSIRRRGWQKLLPFWNSCWADVSATKDYFETSSVILVGSVWFACVRNRRLNTLNTHTLNYFYYAQKDLAITMQIISAYTSIISAMIVQSTFHATSTLSNFMSNKILT